MVGQGIVAPTKFTRSALQNAASVAAIFLTTESRVADYNASGGCLIWVASAVWAA